eukprot:TRINITY_DN4699_c0_g1_i2.p1 TRINITY_DN4699_c0_g1~~TRINITY_DN4699_c0_g1_i2.p1  ORF type:complete len:850 (+),score=284.73 TRINITY_DN4699_c0_g1_i2:75-2624(+)
MCMGGRLSGRCCSPSLVYSEPMIVPLTGATSNVKIMDYCAEVEIRQRYENKEKDPIEAVFEFPLEDGAAVCNFWAEIDGKKIIGTIKEAEKAKEIYDDAIASGHGAYLLEEVSDNKFSASIGNLPPGKAVIIVVTYVVELGFDDGKLLFSIQSLPYAPDGVKTRKFEPPSSEEYTKEVPYGIAINVSFKMTSNIKSISSPSHPISFEFGDSPQDATVIFSNPDGTPLIHDFVLQTTLAQVHKPCGRIQQREDEKIAMVSIYPELEEGDECFSEFIFVVDRSGSMKRTMGKSFRIEQAKQTLQLFLRSLPMGQLFNIVSFGDRFSKLYPTSQEYNDKTLKEATQHVEAMEANMGGTEIVAPLMEIFREPVKEGIPRQIFLLTDGEVRNTQECIDIVRKHANTTRVFTFGVGPEASKALVMGMAKAGEGKFEIIANETEMKSKVMRQLDNALKPAFTDIKIDWGTTKVQQTPYWIPPCFEGSRVIVYGTFENSEFPREVKITAASAAGPFQCTVPIEESVTPGHLFFKLSAKSMLRDLEEGRSFMHNDKGVLSKGKTSKDVDQMTIALSIKNSIVSKLTSFVAVEKREGASQGEMHLREVNFQRSDIVTSSSSSRTRTPSSPVTGGGAPRSRGGAPTASRGGASPSALLSQLSPVSSSAPKGASLSTSSSVARPMARMARSSQSEGFKNSFSSSSSKEKEKKKAAPEMKMEALSLKAASPRLSSGRSLVGGIAAPTPAKEELDVAMQIINTQNANGSFSLHSLELYSPSINAASIKSAMPSSISEPSDEIIAIIVTAIAIAIFEIKFAQQKTDWNLVVKKARIFVKKESGKAGISTVDDIHTSAIAFVQSL